MRQALEDIYLSAFSLPAYFELFHEPANLNAMAIYDGGDRPRQVIAYCIAGSEASVLNELAAIPPEYLAYFCGALFRNSPEIDTIRFRRLPGDLPSPAHPWRLWQRSHDIVVPLPESFANYRSQLGKKTQKHLRYYVNRLEREQHQVSFEVAEAARIAPASVARIVELNRLRMRGKRITSGFDAALEHKVTALCHHCGLVATLQIGERIVAGAICYQVGDQAFLEAIAHDPEFNRYNAGQICLYLTIERLIADGKRSFHLLWGENEYKYRFLGVKHDLYEFSVYRSAYRKLLAIPELIGRRLDRARQQAVYLTRKYLLQAGGRQ
jgi:CelD/BcsL family acetyltransferase involved in cellulose biosynthesis